jgi:ATP-dependent DNA helicase RecQ
MVDLKTELRERFGLEDFRTAQEEVISHVMAGQDVLCVMPTGAGKSLCYQLPAAVAGGLSVVVSPLISLMEDQVVRLGEQGIAALMLNSSQDAAEQRQPPSNARCTSNCGPGSTACCTSRRSGFTPTDFWNSPPA